MKYVRKSRQTSDIILITYLHKKKAYKAPFIANSGLSSHNDVINNMVVSQCFKFLNPFMPSGLFYLNFLIGSFPIKGVSGYFLLLLLLSSCFVGISELNANRRDPDQTQRSAASDLGLHCLPMSL